MNKRAEGQELSLLECPQTQGKKEKKKHNRKQNSQKPNA